MQLRYLAALAMMLMMTAPASAQSCTFTNTGLDWGAINLAVSANYDTTGTFTATCSGTGGATVRVCPNFNAGSGGVNATGTERYMLAGANQLRYNIYRNNGHTQAWGSHTWGLAPTPPTINITLNAGGTGSGSQTMFGRVFSGQTALPAGTYTSLFSGTNTQIAYAYSTVGNCAAIGTTNSTSVPFTATLRYNTSCSVSATTLNFGSSGVISSNIDASNTISVTCTVGTPYTVSLDGGNSGAANPTLRKMANPGNTAFVTYGIYRDAARSLPWGSTIGSNTVAGTGTGSAQSITAYGRVPPQTTPAAQTYTDTIIVTVTYN